MISSSDDVGSAARAAFSLELGTVGHDLTGVTVTVSCDYDCDMSRHNLNLLQT